MPSQETQGKLRCECHAGTFPFEHTWWTVRVYDQYGSTIHADPLLIQAESVAAQAIANSNTGQDYASIQQAINDALEYDEIVPSAGACQYLENLDFRGKSLTLRSTDPNDPNVVAATIIVGDRWAPVVTLSSGASEPPILDGLTIVARTTAISYRDASPTIVRCVVAGNGASAIEFWEGYEPTIIDCNILGDVVQVDDPRIIARWKLDETEGMIAHDSAGDHDATVIGVPLWQPDGGMVGGALQFSGMPNFATAEMVRDPSEGPLGVFAWIKGGVPGQAIVSQQAGYDWLMLDPATGALMTELRSGGRQSKVLSCEAVVTDGNWHRVGFTWDGANRRLYVDDILVAEDTDVVLAGCSGGLNIGCGKLMTPASFFTGLIDDVRVYSRAVRP